MPILLIKDIQTQLKVKLYGQSPINIDDIKGKVSGISYDSTGRLSAEVINIQGNLTIVINNPTKEVIAELKKILQAPLVGSGINDQGITTQNVKETKQSINRIKSLLSKADKRIGKPTQAIKADNVEISRKELLLKDAGTMAYEYLQNEDYGNALEWSNKAIRIILIIIFHGITKVQLYIIQENTKKP